MVKEKVQSRFDAKYLLLHLSHVFLATLALSTLVDVDVDSDRRIEVNFTNAHLELDKP